MRKEAINLNDVFSIRVNNTTNSEQKVKILFPNELKEENYGNAKGVIVQSNRGSYDSLLAGIDGNLIVIQSVCVGFDKGYYSDSCLQNAIVIHEQDVFGNYHGKCIQAKKDPYQNQSHVVCANEKFVLNNIGGSTGLIITINPHTSMTYELYPLKMTAEDLIPEHYFPSYGKDGGINLEEVKSPSQAQTEFEIPKNTANKKKDIPNSTVKKTTISKSRKNK